MNSDLIAQKAKVLRKWSLISTSEAASGHPTSCLSAADLGAVLFEKYFRYDLDNPTLISNDRFVLSKGHASPLFYALYAMSGVMPLSDLKTLRQFNSNLEGHPTPAFKYTDAATGSLGQGLSVGAGMAYGIKNEIGNSPKVFVMLGDGEMAEGQIWEAANFASHYKLDNLIVIADVNRLGQSDETMFGHHIEEYMARFTAFGFEVIAIDGHNLFEIDKAYSEATQNTSGKPYAIIAKTYKGKGVSFLENADGWHGKALPKDKLEDALKELGEVDDTLRFELPMPTVIQGESKASDSGQARMTDSEYKTDDLIATREVYGAVLAKLGDTNPAIYALDGDMKNSTFSQDFLASHPERFVECFIAEQNMVSVAVGLSRLGKVPFVSTFDSFLTRAADQIRMAAISKANISFCGSHIGVSIGEDGPSQMGLENIGLFATIPDAVIFEPSDAVSTSKIVPLLAEHKGISYLRTLRPKLPVLYDNAEEFKIGGSKILKQSEKDELTVVAVGITVHEALKAYDMLEKDGILVRIVDCYSLKPIDADTLKLCVSETLKPLMITVEDYFMHGGLGDLVLNAVNGTGATVKKLALDHISRSGKPADLLKDAGIDAESIVAAVKKMIA
ncbi:transketolase [soil metagenome]